MAPAWAIVFFFFEAQRTCLLTLIPFISSCQPFWEWDSHMTMTSDNTTYIGSLSFLEEVVTSMQCRTPGGENIHPPQKKKKLAPSLGDSDFLPEN